MKQDTNKNSNKAVNKDNSKNKYNKTNKSKEGKFVTLIAVKGNLYGLIVLIPEESRDDFLKRYKDFKEM